MLRLFVFKLFKELLILMSSVLKVSQINTYLKSIFESDFNLQNIYVSGEISNFTNHYRSGHFYFTLKDETSSIKAVMFRNSAERLRFMPENGMKVLVRCNVSVFERDGIYQLYCEDMQPEGIGELTIAFEALKKKLSEEGLFSSEYKKALPEMPLRIGVVTSPTGAALQDIHNVISRRFPCAQLILAPVKVQGEFAAGEIAEAIKKFDKLSAADVLIVGRGGGSIEDLWAFNEEVVARAVFDCSIPVVSAVGHETDFTICDFVSDMRAPTPSAAAEICVPDYREILYSADKTLDYMAECILRMIEGYSVKILQYDKCLASNSPQKTLQLYSQCVDACEANIKKTMAGKIEVYQNILSLYTAGLEATSPLKTLARGYAIVNNEMSMPVKSAAELNADDKITLLMNGGKVNCTVNEVVIENTADTKG